MFIFLHCSQSENSVKDILARFNQGNGPPVGMRPGPPHVASKPGKPTKPDNLATNKDHSNDKKSPSRGKGQGAVPALNLNDITSVRLRKPPLPKTPAEKRDSLKETPEWLQPKPTKPKPPTTVRGDSGISSGSSTSPLPSPAHLKSPSQPKSPAMIPSPTHNESSLHPKPISAKAPVPNKKTRPPPPARKDSVQKAGSPTVPEKPGSKTSFGKDENKENHLRNGINVEPIPPVSDSENSSASSITEFRRTSFLHGNKSKPLKPQRQPLPPEVALGKAPRKPAKPPNVSLAKFKSTSGKTFEYSIFFTHTVLGSILKLLVNRSIRIHISHIIMLLASVSHSQKKCSNFIILTKHCLVQFCLFISFLDETRQQYWFLQHRTK